jgi:hypothetical protein
MALDKLKSSALDTNIDVAGTLDVTGVTTLDSNLKVGTTTNAWSGNNTVVIKEDSGDGGITLVSSSTSNNMNIGFADTETSSFADQRGLITYMHASDDMRFMTANSEKMRILSSGGITFNGDTAAANALDDYEEGDWTPVLTRWTSDMTFSGSPTSRIAKYIKIGKMLHINFYIQWATSAVTSAGSGGWRITGLPFSNYVLSSGNFLKVGYFYDGIDSKGESTTGDSARLQVNYSSGIMDMYGKNALSYGTSGPWFIISANGTLRLT